MKTDLKTKLSSRKLWAAVAAFVATILVAIFKEDIPPDAVSLIRNGVIALCVYIFGEAGVDIARMIWQVKDVADGNNISTTQESQTSGNSEINAIEPETVSSAKAVRAAPRESETHSDTSEEEEN